MAETAKEETKPATGTAGGKAWKRWLKRSAMGLLGVGLLLGVCGGGYGYVQTSAYDASMAKVYDVPPMPLARSTDDAVIARGKHLVGSIAGCGVTDCHGPTLAGGKVTEMGPLARLVAPNITPAGLAVAYTDGELARLIRHGIKKDGRSAAFMPVMDFNWLPDSDLVAIISYLRTVPAVDKPSEAVVVKPFGKILDRKNLLPFDVARQVPHDHFDLGPAPTPTAEYGRYISHLCTGCHGEHLGGGPLPGAPPDMAVPLNLTPDATGLEGWTFEDFEHLIATKTRKNGTPLKSAMPVEALAGMDDVERHALWAYLQALPPKPFGSR